MPSYPLRNPDCYAKVCSFLFSELEQVFFLLAALILCSFSTSLQTTDQGFIIPTDELLKQKLVTLLNNMITSPTPRLGIVASTIPNQATSTFSIPVATITFQNSTPEIVQSPTPPDQWMSLPIIPTISEKSREIFKQGSALGRNPLVFSKIRNYQSITTYFLKNFDFPVYTIWGTMETYNQPLVGLLVHSREKAYR